ncbi:hypothetical protein RchiOBHm_Chr6g0289051 [Rosa chinensis]|uniref:Uncharacterized protein n=1 Tax=Rosa chinensis TaxID=74649 RepID=A0A2P6PVH8_ROSCH|nr:hypothetical protein RchiOBHm_Chr6g0289051 [Rosa chinensis]
MNLCVGNGMSVAIVENRSICEVENTNKHSTPRETTTEIQAQEHKFKMVQQNFCLRPPGRKTIFHYIYNGYNQKE